MHCVDFSKCKVVYYSFLLLKISSFQRLLSSIPSLDRRIKKIETICHCKIKIDCVDREKCNKVLDAYHLIEVYYNETNGNHSGCIYMFKEILKDYGNVQTVITINKSKDGRIYKRNYMTENASYKLFQNSKAANSRYATKINLANNVDINRLEPDLSKDLYDKLSEKSDKVLPVSFDLTKELSRPTTIEMIEQNLSNSQNSVEEEMVLSQMNDDQLLHHYALNRSIHSDLKFSKVVIKSNASEVADVDKNINSPKKSQLKSQEKPVKLSYESMDPTEKLIEISLTETNEDFESIKEEFSYNENVGKTSNESKFSRIKDASEELISELSLSVSGPDNREALKSETISYKSILSGNSLKKLQESISSRKGSGSKMKNTKDIFRKDVAKELKLMLHQSLEENKVDRDRRESQDIFHQTSSPHFSLIKEFEIRKKSIHKSKSDFDISIDNTFYPNQDLSEFACAEDNDEFVSVISNASSLYQSSSTEFDDALSHSTLDEVSRLKEKCSNVSLLLSKFEVETSENSNSIDDFIDEVASVHFEEYRVFIKHKLKEHIDAIKISTTQLANTLSEMEISKEITFIADQTIDDELKLWNDLINFYVKIINTNLWKSIRKVSEESVSQSNTEQLRLETLFEEVLSTKASKSVQEMDSSFTATFQTAMVNLNAFPPLSRSKVHNKQAPKSNLTSSGKKEKLYMKYIKQQRNTSNYFNPIRVQENLKLNRKVPCKSMSKTNRGLFCNDFEFVPNKNEKSFDDILVKETNNIVSIKKCNIPFPSNQSTFVKHEVFPWVTMKRSAPLNQSNIEKSMLNTNRTFIKTVNSFVIDYGNVSKDSLKARNISNYPVKFKQNNLNPETNSKTQKSIQKMSKNYFKMRKSRNLINKKYLLKRSFDLSDSEYVNYKKRKFLAKQTFLTNKKNRYLFMNSLGISNNLKLTSIMECHLNSQNYVNKSNVRLNDSWNFPIQSYNKYLKQLDNNVFQLSLRNQENFKEISFRETGIMSTKQYIIRRKNKRSKSLNQKKYVLENPTQINKQFPNNSKLPPMINLKDNLQFISVKCCFNQSIEKVNLYRKFLNDRNEIKVEKFNNNNKKNLCCTVSIMTIKYAEIIIKMTPIMEKAVELSESFYRDHLTISNESVYLNRDFSRFYYEKNRKIREKFDKKIEVSVKMISFIICVTMDIDLVMRDLYLEIYKETVLDVLKSQGNPKQRSTSSDYCTIYSYDKEFDSFILDEF